MREKLRNYFIGEYLKKTEDVFEHARAIMLLQFSIMFFIVFSLPLVADFALGYEKAAFVHSLIAVALFIFPFIIRKVGNLDLAINIFFILFFMASVVISMMLNPTQIDAIGMAWALLFLILSALLQRGWIRILFCFFLGWLSILYIIVNSSLDGMLTWEWIQQKGAETPPIFLAFIPTLIGIYAVWSHRNTVDTAKKTIITQKEIIEEKNKSITDSIAYAKHLQGAILPPLDYISAYFKNYFILYKPKDVVAGDFYWFEKQGDKLFIAAADCTGHGVPGAMVSVICSGALNRAVNEYQISETGRILDKTRELVVETFERSGLDVKDGMDISLLCVDFVHQKIEWSGANNPLWMFLHDNDTPQFKEVKPDKQPVGKTEHAKSFVTNEISYKQNTTFYLLTDGFADQFGGETGKKMKAKRLLELIKEATLLPISKQAAFLDNAFTSWQGSLEQVDDVCIIGIRL